jgi:hypothetical protein
LQEQLELLPSEVEVEGEGEGEEGEDQHRNVFESG